MSKLGPRVVPQSFHQRRRASRAPSWESAALGDLGCVGLDGGEGSGGLDAVDVLADGGEDGGSESTRGEGLVDALGARLLGGAARRPG